MFITVHLPRRNAEGFLIHNVSGATEYLAVGGVMDALRGGLFSRNMQGVEPVTYNEMLSLGYKSPFGTDIRNTLLIAVENKDIVIALHEVTMTVSATHNIVTTPLAGKSINGFRGTVKEFVSRGDYDIHVSGILRGTNPQAYPYEELSMLVRVLEDGGRLTLAAKYLEPFGITQAVIKKYDIPQKTGNINEQEFTLKLLSDEDVELELN